MARCHVGPHASRGRGDTGKCRDTGSHVNRALWYPAPVQTLLLFLNQNILANICQNRGFNSRTLQSCVGMMPFGFLLQKPIWPTARILLSRSRSSGSFSNDLFKTLRATCQPFIFPVSTRHALFVQESSCLRVANYKVKGTFASV